MVPIRVFTTPGKEHLARYALHAAEQTIHHLDGYYGIRYPYKKLDVIAVPDFEAGAMENIGAIVYRETALLAGPAKASAAAPRNIACILAHEIAHMAGSASGLTSEHCNPLV